MSEFGLTLHEHRVRDVVLGDTSGFADGVLTVDPGEAAAVAACEEPVEGLSVGVARPGEPVRCNRVLDVLEPRAKVEGGGTTFPGIATGETACGTGVTAAALGMALVATGTFTNLGGAFEQQDCVVDMTGPGARHTPFSRTVNLVLDYRLAEGAEQAGAERAVREANVRLARWIGGLLPAGAPDERRTVDVAGAGPGAEVDGRPRLAYVCQLISEGCIHETLLRGRSTDGLDPTWLSAAEMADGALVSADFHYACQRVPTYLYQRNPVIEALLRRRDEVALAGVAVTIRRETDGDKRRAAATIARLASERGVTGLITHPAVGGNAQLDALYVVEQAERLGIRTAMIVQEMAGPDGADPGLVDSVPEADLLLSTGNREELVSTAPIEQVLGEGELLDGSNAAGVLRVPLRLLLGSTSQVGAWHVRGTAA